MQLTVKEFAQQKNVSMEAVRKQIQTGKLAATRVGKHWVVEVGDNQPKVGCDQPQVGYDQPKVGCDQLELAITNLQLAVTNLENRINAIEITQSAINRQVADWFCKLDTLEEKLGVRM